MNLLEATEKVSALASSNASSIGAKIKFKFAEGVIFIDDSQSAPVVNNDDAPADCVIRVSLDNFEQLVSGKMNAMGAFMMGKIKIDGDMSLAMKLSNLF